MISLSAQSMLGDTATFFGVIISLIVLCLATNKSNFIWVVLDDFSSRIKEKFSTLERICKLNAVTGSPQFQKLKKFTAAVGVKDPRVKGVDAATIGAAQQLEFDILMESRNLNQTYFGAINRMHTRVEESREPLQAPYYTMIAVMLLFVGDEITRIYGLNSVTGKFTLAVITTFFFLSAIFWTYLWIAFHNGYEKLEDADDYPAVTKVFSHIHALIKSADNIHTENVSRYIVHFIIWAVISSVLFCFLTLPVNDIIVSSIGWIGIGIVLPLYLMTDYRLHNHFSTLRQYNYSFLLKHFVILGGGSLFLVGLTLLNPMICDAILKYEHTTEICFWWKLSVIALVTLNAFVLPLVIPYNGRKNIHRRLIFFIAEAEKAEKDATKKFLDRLDEVCAKIPTL